MANRHFLLFYDYRDDYLTAREPLRGEHLGLAQTYAEEGILLLGGVLEDPVDSAVLLFSAEDDAPVRAFVEADPYVRHGLVTAWTIRSWNTVAGKDAAHPILTG